MRRELSSALLAGATVLLGACSDGHVATERGGFARSTSQAIVNGTASGDAQDYVVQISIEKLGAMIPHCTGTMIAKNLVVTARHCVGELDSEETSIENFDAADLAFYTGIDAGPKTADEQPEARGAKLFDNGKKTLIPDIAVVLLDRDLDVPIAAIRLEGGAVKGEALDIIGYGLTEDDVYPSVRQQRKGVKVVKVGPGSSKLFELTAGEFQLGEAACAGDSGGPAIAAETGALVGVASRVSNGEGRSSLNPASFCLGRSAEDIYTDLTPAQAFIQAALDEAGATPWIEGEPSPEEKAAADEAAADALAEQEADRNAATSAAACSAGGPAAAPRALVLAFVASVLALGARRRRRERPHAE